MPHRFALDPDERAARFQRELDRTVLAEDANPHGGEDERPNVCGFCQGRPVGNAATWVDGIPRPPAACPRCGETHFEEAA